MLLKKEHPPANRNLSKWSEIASVLNKEVSRQRGKLQISRKSFNGKDSNTNQGRADEKIEVKILQFLDYITVNSATKTRQKQKDSPDRDNVMEQEETQIEEYFDSTNLRSKEKLESLVKRVLLAHDFDSGFCTIPGVLFFRLKEAFKSQWPIIPSSNFLVENIDLKRNEDDFQVTSSHQGISKSLFNLDKSVVIIKESDDKGDSISESNSVDDNDYDINIEENGTTISNSDSRSMISKGKEEEKR